MVYDFIKCCFSFDIVRHFIFPRAGSTEFRASPAPWPWLSVAALHTQHPLCRTPLPTTRGVNLQHPPAHLALTTVPSVSPSHAAGRQGVSTSSGFRGWCETLANHGCGYRGFLAPSNHRKRQKCPPDFLLLVLFTWPIICLRASLWDLTWQQFYSQLFLFHLEIAIKY